MKKLTKMFLILACCLAVAAGGWMNDAYAAPSANAAGQAAAKPATASAVAVTDAQKARLKDIAKKYQDAVAPLMKKYVAEKIKLERMMNAEIMDEASIRTQFSKASGIGADLIVLRARRTHDLRAVLTSEQMKKFQKMEKEISGVNVDRMLLGLAYPAKGK